MPKSLYVDEDTVKANVLMTLVHESDLNASFGSEYCRSNIEVSLGTYDPGEDRKQHQQKKIPEDPKLTASAYEKDLVEHGFKWSPVKVYRREMSRVQGQTWRLDLSVEHRSGQPTIEPQRAALIITVADPLKKAPVYDEMVGCKRPPGKDTAAAMIAGGFEARCDAVHRSWIVTPDMNLKTIVRMYIQRIRPRAQAELDWFMRQPTLRDAIKNAALAKNSRGKRYSHQRRIKKVAIQEALSILSNESDQIKRSRSFAELFELINSALEDIPGIGELYIYDTSLRIGAKLNLFPARVYLHAGTRLGARALDLRTAATLRISELPKEFRALKPHEIEDVLCIFKNRFALPASHDIVSRSWCA